MLYEKPTMIASIQDSPPIVHAEAPPAFSSAGTLLCVLYVFLFIVVNATGTSEGIFDLRRTTGTAESDLLSSGLYLYVPVYALAIYQFYFRFNLSGTLFPGDWIIWLLLFFSSISAAWSLSPVTVLKSNIHFIGLLFIASNTGYVAAHNSKRFISMLMYAMGLISLASILLVYLAPDLSIMEIGGIHRWAGITRQPNTLGMMAMIGTVPSIYQYTISKNISGKLVALVFLVMNIICVLGSKSMTSLVISFFVIVGFPLFLSIASSDSVLAALAKMFAILWLIALLAACINFLNPSLLGFEYILNLFGRDKTLTGRADLWVNAWTAFMQKPLLGWSFDNLVSLLSSAFKSKIRYGQLHNGYLDMLVRGGLVGFSILLMLLISAVMKILSIRKQDPMFFAFLLFIFFLVMIHNISEASFMRNPSTLWFLLLSAYFSSMNLHRGAQRHRWTISPPLFKRQLSGRQCRTI